MHETPGPPDHAIRLATGAIQVPSRSQPNGGRCPERIAETRSRTREQTLVKARDVAKQRRGPAIASFPCARTFRAQACSGKAADRLAEASPVRRLLCQVDEDPCLQPWHAGSPESQEDANHLPPEFRRQSCAAVRDRCRSEEHTSELQSLMRTSYAVFCLKK